MSKEIQRSNEFAVEYQHFLRQLLVWLLVLELLATTALPNHSVSAEDQPPELPDITAMTCAQMFEIPQEAIDAVYGTGSHPFTSASVEDSEEVHGQDNGTIPPITPDIHPYQLNLGMSGIPLFRKEIENAPLITETEILTYTSLISGEKPITYTNTVYGGGIPLLIIFDSGMYDLKQQEKALEDGVIIQGPNLISPTLPTGEPNCNDPDNFGHGGAALLRIISDDPTKSIVTYPAIDGSTEVPFRVLVMKVLNDKNGTTWDTLVKAILIATHLKASVISMSLGGSPTRSENIIHVTNAINYAAAHGVVTVSAAGNYANTPDLLPGCVANPNTIRVAGSSLYDGQIVNTYNTACFNVPGITVAATTPIVSLDRYGTVTTFGGTSAATPSVSALTALIVAKRGLTPHKASKYLTENFLGRTSDMLNYPGLQGYVLNPLNNPHISVFREAPPPFQGFLPVVGQ